MKTKEEILENQFYTPDREDTERILQAMSEYAKQDAMEFAEWCELNMWTYSRITGYWNKLHENDFTTAELYAKFEAERNQHQSELTCPICQSNRILEWPDKYQCRKCEHVWGREAK